MLNQLCIALMLSLSLETLAIAQPSTLQVNLKRLLKDIPASKVTSETGKAMRQALVLVGEDRLEEGSQQLNAALKLDPSNSYLQFFNAFAYHQMAQLGDAQKFGLAEQGYLLAVQFDASNWIAHYFLGTMYFEQRNFAGAQQQWAAVLLSQGEDQEVLLRMVAASYYAGDPVTAAVCLERLRLLTPTDPQVLKLSALVSAAINQPEQATQWLSLFKGTFPPDLEVLRLQQRVSHWAVVHRNNKSTNSMVPSYAFAQGEAFDGANLAHDPAMIRTQSNPTAAQVAQVNRPKFDPDDASAKRMVLVDVVIMRTEDSLGTRKGINLLNALTLQFGGISSPAFSKTFSSNDSGQTGNDLTNSTATAITRAISIPALSYSLNIVNANANLNEVLARPTLAALNGEKSEFFSGTTLNAAVVSSSTVTGSAVQIEKEIGVKLSILPTFLKDNKIRLTVDAQRTFLKPPSSDVTYTYKLETSKIMVNANVVMEFGETLVLGGLSEKETTNVRDGVPLLQDIPGLQYLFSSKKSDDFQRSVLMLITPREPQYTFRKNSAGLVPSDLKDGTKAVTGGESMNELRARYGDWFKPYPNLASVFSQLNSSSVYREFRTGDVTLEKWDKQSTTFDRLKQALDFLFY
jgi:tetratricopeptide (TPR) repeat protein